MHPIIKNQGTVRDVDVNLKGKHQLLCDSLLEDACRRELWAAIGHCGESVHAWQQPKLLYRLRGGGVSGFTVKRFHLAGTRSLGGPPAAPQAHTKPRGGKEKKLRVRTLGNIRRRTGAESRVILTEVVLITDLHTAPRGAGDSRSRHQPPGLLFRFTTSPRRRIPTRSRHLTPLPHLGTRYCAQSRRSAPNPDTRSSVKKASLAYFCACSFTRRWYIPGFCRITWYASS